MGFKSWDFLDKVFSDKVLKATKQKWFLLRGITSSKQKFQKTFFKKRQKTDEVGILLYDNHFVGCAAGSEGYAVWCVICFK
jgi:hypothetical protein